MKIKTLKEWSVKIARIEQENKPISAIMYRGKFYIYSPVNPPPMSKKDAIEALQEAIDWIQEQ